MLSVRGVVLCLSLTLAFDWLEFKFCLFAFSLVIKLGFGEIFFTSLVLQRTIYLVFCWRFLNLFEVSFSQQQFSRSDGTI